MVTLDFGGLGVSQLDEEVLEVCNLFVRQGGGDIDHLLGVGQNLGDLVSRVSQQGELLVLVALGLVGGWKKVWEELESHREKQLGKGDDDEHGEREESQHVCGGSLQLSVLSSGELVPGGHLEQESGGDFYLQTEQLRALPVVVGFVLDLFPDGHFLGVGVDRHRSSHLCRVL